MKETQSSKHSTHSSLREQIIEHLFIGEILRYFWNHDELDVQILRSEVDSAGYDLIISKASIARYIQLKSSLISGKTDEVSMSVVLAGKPNGCIVWIVVDNSLNLTGYRWFGAAPGESFPELSKFKVSKQSKGDKDGKKSERPNHRKIPKSSFTLLKSLDAVVEKLFGNA